MPVRSPSSCEFCNIENKAEIFSVMGTKGGIYSEGEKSKKLTVSVCGEQ